MQVYFPNCAEVSDTFETPLSPKATAMVPLEFKAYKSEVVGASNLIRMTTGPTT